MKLNLISNGNTNAKTIKNDQETYILYLSPYNLNDTGKNVCPFATKGCAKACLNSAGRGKFSNVQLARRRKTNLFFQDPQKFTQDLALDLAKINNKALKENKTIFVRLNGTSDINFEKLLNRYLNISFAQFAGLKFYDYTKDKNKALEYSTNEKRVKYRITYSRSEKDTDMDIKTLLNNGVNVAAVFSKDLPNTYLGYPVINGDETDLRFNDQLGVIVGLKAKGAGKKDTSGFVIQSSLIFGYN
jgi:hypothetical protein